MKFSFLIFLLLFPCVLSEKSFMLRAIIRDFTPSHEHFNSSSLIDKESISSTLDEDKKPSLESDSSQDKYLFSQWFRTMNNVNSEIPIDLIFEPIYSVKDVYFYSNSNYFPIDHQGFGNWRRTGHNYHFTTEIKTKFEYTKGTYFSISGGDNIFVYINKKLAIELKGSRLQFATIEFGDEIETYFNLEIGEKYELYIFQAKRLITPSIFKIETSLALTNDK